MLDIRFVRDHADEVQENARRKGYDVDIAALLGLDRNKRQLQQQAFAQQQRRMSLLRDYNDTGVSPPGGVQYGYQQF